MDAWYTRGPPPATHTDGNIVVNIFIRAPVGAPDIDANTIIALYYIMLYYIILYYNISKYSVYNMLYLTKV